MSKSLGTLTLDLVARIGSFTGLLDRASQEAKKHYYEKNDQPAVLLQQISPWQKAMCYLIIPLRSSQVRRLRSVL